MMNPTLTEAKAVQECYSEATLRKLSNILKFLVLTRGKYVEQQHWGICRNLREGYNVDISQLINIIYWESGPYPVPSPHPYWANQQAFENIADKYKGEYGKLRLEFADELRQKIDYILENYYDNEKESRY